MVTKRKNAAWQGARIQLLAQKELSMTRQVLIAAISAVLAVPAWALDHPAQTRKIPCKTEGNATSCYWTHGRLEYGNGTPALRLWKTGTHRLLGIYSGPSINVRGDDKGDNEHPELPASLSKQLIPARDIIWADFEVCPLEPARPGAMQPACIESAKKVFVEKLE